VIGQDGRALKKAQGDLDLRPERYTHYYTNEFLERFHTMMDNPPLGTRRANCLRILFKGGVRTVLCLDRRARHLRQRRSGDYDKAVVSFERA
jgi:hypothetical protein